MKPTPMRVVHGFPVWLPQTQTWMYHQVKYLPDLIEAHVVCEQTQNLDQFDLPNLHCLRDESIVKFYWQKALRKLGVKQHLDYLTMVAEETGSQAFHSHFGYIGWANLGALEPLRIKHVVTFYGEDVNRFPVQEKKWVNRYQVLFARADHFLCEGPHMKNCLVQLGCPPEKITVHHLGVETGKIAYRPRQWLRGEPLRVLIASSFREKKGIPYALEALAGLQSLIPLEITLIGDATPDASSQNEKRRIIKIVTELGLEDKVTFFGFQPQAALIDAAYNHHVFILPSITASDGDTEGGAPVILVEMIASGMPVVSTKHCDIPGVVDYGIDNWLVNERDVEGLGDRVQWLMDHAPDWNEFLTVGRRHIEKEFDATIQGRKLGKIYRDLMSGRVEPMD